jgi:hypothetical protein
LWVTALKSKAIYNINILGYDEASRELWEFDDVRRYVCETDLDFNLSTAERLMAVARDKRLRNPAHAQALPPAWYTLYELTKLTDQQFEKGIAIGAINPRLSRQEAAVLAGHILPPLMVVDPTTGESTPFTPSPPNGPPEPDACPPGPRRVHGHARNIALTAQARRRPDDVSELIGYAERRKQLPRLWNGLEYAELVLKALRARTEGGG